MNKSINLLILQFLFLLNTILYLKQFIRYTFYYILLKYKLYFIIMYIIIFVLNLRDDFSLFF